MEDIAYDIPAAVKSSKMSRSQLYEFIKSGELPIIKVGSRTLILPADLRALILARRQPK